MHLVLGQTQHYSAVARWLCNLHAKHENFVKSLCILYVRGTSDKKYCCKYDNVAQDCRKSDAWTTIVVIMTIMNRFTCRRDLIDLLTKRENVITTTER